MPKLVGPSGKTEDGRMKNTKWGFEVGGESMEPIHDSSFSNFNRYIFSWSFFNPLQILGLHKYWIYSKSPALSDSKKKKTEKSPSITVPISSRLHFWGRKGGKLGQRCLCFFFFIMTIKHISNNIIKKLKNNIGQMQ